MHTTQIRMLCGLAILVAAPAAWGLDLGDPAPPLQIDKWVQGEPLSLEAEREKNFVVIDFFSSVCPPSLKTTSHLSDLHRKYKDRGVKFVSVCGDAVEFIEWAAVPAINPAPDYRLAHDRWKHQTSIAYVAGAGITTLPFAVIVDREGRAAWMGTPDQRIDAVIESMLAGSYDIQAEKQRQSKRKADFNALVNALYAGAINRAGSLLETLQPLEMEETFRLATLYPQATQAGNVAAAIVLGKIALELEERPIKLNEWAWELLTAEGLAGKYAELALPIARKAYAAEGDAAYDIADTLALALFETGHVAEAVELQRHALKLAEEKQDRNVDVYRQTLARYEAALSETK